MTQQHNHRQPGRPAAPGRNLPANPRVSDNYGTGAVPPTIAELHDLVGQLRDVMAEETAALERFDYQNLPRMTEQKRIFAGLLREKQQVLKEHPDALQQAPEEERRKLEQLLGDMQTIGKRNEIVVRTARDANKLLLDAIIRGATKQSQLGTGYGRSGAMTALTTNYGARQPVSLFSNERC